MNVYDQAHQLASAIRESEEYKRFHQAKVQLETNPGLNDMMKDFQSKSMDIQIKQMGGEQPDPEEMQKLQQLYAIVAMDPLASGYMEAEMRFSLMMKDVYEILGDVVGEGGVLK